MFIYYALRTRVDPKLSTLLFRGGDAFFYNGAANTRSESVKEIVSEYRFPRRSFQRQY